MRRCLLGLAILVLVMHGSNWDVEALDSVPYALVYASIATDTDNRPHIVFTAEQALGYARFAGGSWNIEYFRTGLYFAETGLVMYLDTDGAPHVIYVAGHDAQPKSLHYAYRYGDTWHVDTVTGPGRYHSLSMALARDGTPHMTFLEDLGDSRFMRYAHKAGDTWSILTVPSEQTDTLRRLHWSGGTLALDTNDRPGIAVSWHKDNCTPEGRDSVWLAVFEYDGQAWHRFEADSGQGWRIYDFWWPRIQCDPATNRFHITYRYGRYVMGRGHNWRSEWAGVSVGHLQYDFFLHEGRPHIACGYQRTHPQYQWRWAGGWEEERIWPDHLRSHPSIAVDREGRPHVAFADLDGTLFYARRLFVGMQEPEPMQPVSGACSPTIVRGRLFLGAGHNPIPPGESGLCPKPLLLDIAGRKVMDLQPGENDVRHLAPGVYFIRAKGSNGRGTEGPNVKVVIQR